MTTLARRVYSAAHLTGSFTLSSGLVSDHYFDKYLFESDPALLRDLAEAMAPLVPSGTEILAGLEMGGIPVATMLSQVTGLPAIFVRKEAKRYGTAKLAEGCNFDGCHVLVVEDVVTTGGQIVLSTADLRERGALVDHALAVLDRERGGRDALEEAGLAFHALLTESAMPPD